MYSFLWALTARIRQHFSLLTNKNPETFNINWRSNKWSYSTSVSFEMEIEAATWCCIPTHLLSHLYRHTNSNGMLTVNAIQHATITHSKMLAASSGWAFPSALLESSSCVSLLLLLMLLLLLVLMLLSGLAVSTGWSATAALAWLSVNLTDGSSSPVTASFIKTALDWRCPESTSIQTGIPPN